MVRLFNQQQGGGCVCRCCSASGLLCLCPVRLNAVQLQGWGGSKWGLRPSALPGSLLEIQILQPRPGPAASEALGSSKPCSNALSGTSWRLLTSEHLGFSRVTPLIWIPLSSLDLTLNYLAWVCLGGPELRLRSQNSEFSEFQLHAWAAGWPYPSHLSYVHLDFLTCQMGILIIYLSSIVLLMIQELITLKRLNMAHSRCSRPVTNHSPSSPSWRASALGRDDMPSTLLFIPTVPSSRWNTEQASHCIPLIMAICDSGWDHVLWTCWTDKGLTLFLHWTPMCARP